MKKITFLIGVALVLSVAVALWAQRDPDSQQPASAFYGSVTYGCACGWWNDHIAIINVTTGDSSDYTVAKCWNPPGYNTRGGDPPVLIQGTYRLHMVCPTSEGCIECPQVQVWHSGMVDQEVNLSTW
jgi:hypothetical protein